MALDEAAHRGQHEVLEQGLHRRRHVGRGGALGEPENMAAECGVVRERAMDLALVVDMEGPRQVLEQGRLAVGREAGELALVTVDAVAERLGGVAIGHAEAVDPTRLEQVTIVAIEGLEAPLAEQAVRVLNVVAAAVAGVEQGLVPIGEEERRQGVAQVMVGETEPGLGAKAAIGEQGGAGDDVLGPGEAGALELERQVLGFLAAQQLTRPALETAQAPEMAVEAPGQGAAGDCHGIDVAAAESGDVENLVDASVGRPAAVALAPRQPFERHRGEQAIVVEQGRRAVVMAWMEAEDDHRRWDPRTTAPSPPRGALGALAAASAPGRDGCLLNPSSLSSQAPGISAPLSGRLIRRPIGAAIAWRRRLPAEIGQFSLWISMMWLSEITCFNIGYRRLCAGRWPSVASFSIAVADGGR